MWTTNTGGTERGGKPMEQIGAQPGSPKVHLRLATATFALAVMAVLLTLDAAPASAYLNRYYDLHNLYYTDADVKMTSFQSPGTTTGYIYINNQTNAYMYVQAKPVAQFAVDGSWKRATNNVAPGRAYGQYWSDRTFGSYNAYKFRICRDVNNAPDVCQTSYERTIYPYR